MHMLQFDTHNTVQESEYPSWFIEYGHEVELCSGCYLQFEGDGLYVSLHEVELLDVLSGPQMLSCPQMLSGSQMGNEEQICHPGVPPNFMTSVSLVPRLSGTRIVHARVYKFNFAFRSGGAWERGLDTSSLGLVPNPPPQSSSRLKKWKVLRPKPSASVLPTFS